MTMNSIGRTAQQAQRPGASNIAKSIAENISQQQSKLLRKGQLDNWGYSQIRQRVLWSTYHFNSANAGSAILVVAGVPTLQPGDYQLFQTLNSQNGQGLPSGFQMTRADTNNLGAGRVPDDQNFAFWELGAQCSGIRQDIVSTNAANMAQGPMHPDDMDRVLSEAVLSIQYLTNQVPIGHLMDFAQSGGPQIAVPSLLNYAGAAIAVGADMTGGLGEGITTVAPFDSRVAKLANNSGNAWANPGTRRKLDVPIFLAATQTYSFIVTIARPIQLRSVANGGTGGFSLKIDGWVVESFRDQG